MGIGKIELNTNDFDEFIKKHGHAGITPEMAHRYADFGDRMIKVAMTSKNFKEDMQNLEAELAQEIQPSDPKYSISNMASCFLYAQTRENFRLNQGYGKGSNINQYGDEATSKRAVKNLMDYFSQEAPSKETGYSGKSTHTSWRQKVPSGMQDKLLRIDIEPDRAHGSIPAPLKGIRTLHLVAGVDQSNITKLLVKPENWGTKTWKGWWNHALDYIKTRFKSHTIPGLEIRGETKLSKEDIVLQALRDINRILAETIHQVQNEQLKQLLQGIEKQIKSAQSLKGFEALDTLSTVMSPLDAWEKENPEDAETHKNILEGFRKSVDASIGKLIDEKNRKYGSEFQRGSEVRLLYRVGYYQTVKARVDNLETKRLMEKHKMNLDSSQTEQTEQTDRKFKLK